MLDRSRTRIFTVENIALLSTYNLVDLNDGASLVAALEGGATKARLARATATDIPLGFAYLEDKIIPSSKVVVERITVSGGGAGTLSRAPISAAAMLVTRVDTGEVLAKNASAGDGQYTATDASVTMGFHSDEYSKVVEVTYRTALTAAESYLTYGESGGAPASLLLQNIPYVTKGVIYTDQFDTTVPWSTIDAVSAAESLKMTATGLLSAGAGVTGSVIVPAAMVIDIPTVASPWLGVRFNF